MTDQEPPSFGTIDRVEAQLNELSMTVLRCVGEFDALVADELSVLITDTLASLGSPSTVSPPAHRPPSGAALVVDLRDVEFLSASTVTALLEGRRRAPSRSPPMHLVIGQNYLVGRVVDLTGLRNAFDVHHDLDDVGCSRQH